jgi:hypothetical protein
MSCKINSMELRDDAVLALDQAMHINVMSRLKKGKKRPNRDIKVLVI